MTRYFGFYSNKSRGLRVKAQLFSSIESEKTTSDEIEIIDISKYLPKNVPSLTWLECIKKIWKEDRVPRTEQEYSALLRCCT